MDSNELKMEDYPAHWKSTLLGEEFWKDAEEFNKSISDSIDANPNPSLLTKFPFSIGTEHITSSQSVDGASEKQQHRRRFSTSDALSLNPFSSRSSSPFPRPRAFDLSRRARSHSRSRSPSSATSTRRSSSILRSPFSMLGSKKTDEGVESAATAPPASPIIPSDQATLAKPLMSFQGGTTWDYLAKDRRTLGLDLFWPVNASKEEDKSNKEMLNIVELEPLSQFRNLRVLKITGMMQSYQKYIWQAAWLNTRLEELEMGMALQPRLRRPHAERWPYIKGGWTLNKAHYDKPVYYGTAQSDGTLDRKVGSGEYLDKILMEKAKICAMAIGRTRQRLSIRTLTLTGFVVDGDPFLHWFDTKRFKCINFKDYCVDAGFYLSLPMKKVSVIYPREVQEKPLVGRKANLLSELKVVELRSGKKVGEIPYRGPESLKQEIPLGGKRKNNEQNDRDDKDAQGRMKGG
ncbi:hypothetical protein EYZ11_000445 [Aspergillus tanneri]|uniref:Uncharacterized protein n=1 Tax=Aspergillus tanneri TaxID=1220188 RepID=A0A4S3JX72_9EURO|nr:uncharacterized protein ATNIH1004_006792 [Aspergillus tanneri]KAA8645373.1 hypothetical protein ATNIH1004_006792 [Aspergillus tanneri]THD00120.1 hypothetical protein EYZ11_000445 [Aspergillus tanneri]